MLIIMSVAMFLFYRSFYWQQSGFSKRKLLEAVIIIFGVVVVPAAIVCINPLNNIVSNIFVKFKQLFNLIKENKKKTVVYVVIVVLIYPIVYLVMHGFTDNKYTILAVATVCYVLFFLYALRNYAVKRTEILFAIVALLIGTFQISTIPLLPGMSADDEAHYERTLVLANVFNGVYYEAEVKAFENYASVILEHDTYDKESRNERYEEYNKLYAEKSVINHGFGERGVWSVAYVPSAIGIILAKGLSLSFTNTLFLSKFMNLLAYVIVSYFAIKIIKSGKVLMSVLCLIPTLIYLAGNFSYDTWVFAFMMLGFSFFANMVRTERKIENKEFIAMNICFLIGILPKAIYVFALIPLLFIPRTRFKARKQRALYYVFIVVTVLLLMASFLIPLLLNTGGASDVRGGADVNSAGQIQYILANKGEFVKNLGAFLNSFLSLDKQNALVQYYEYLGKGQFTVLTIVVIAIVAFVDKAEKVKDAIAVRVSSFITFIICNAMVAVSMYIIFTAVASESVAGCQNRYILPTLIPLCLFVIPGIKAERIDKNRLAIVSIAIISLTFIFNIYYLSIIYY